MDEKRTLDELFALYELEPTLTDIYVEGATDKAIIEWFLERQSVSGVNVYSIDLIDISNMVIQKHGLNTRSNRSKIVALSAELYSQLQERITVLCIADRDFEDYIPKVTPHPLLCFTDGNSMETYIFNEPCLRKFTSLVLGGFALSPRELLQCLEGILRKVYAMRLANEVLGWNMKNLDFTRYVSLIGKRVEFDEKGYIRAYLQKNGKWSYRQRFLDNVNECVRNLSSDCTRSARGHDLSELLHHLIRRLRPDRKFGNRETLEGALLGTMESSDLQSYPLFCKIMALRMSHN